MMWMKLCYFQTEFVMMTNGPAASIGEILPIELDRPRNRIELADKPAIQSLSSRGTKVFIRKTAQGGIR